MLITLLLNQSTIELILFFSDRINSIKVVHVFNGTGTPHVILIGICSTCIICLRCITVDYFTLSHPIADEVIMKLH